MSYILVRITVFSSESNLSNIYDEIFADKEMALFYANEVINSSKLKWVIKYKYAELEYDNYNSSTLTIMNYTPSINIDKYSIKKLSKEIVSLIQSYEIEESD